MQLMQASRQWATRPADERFATLTELHAYNEARRAISKARVVSSRQIQVVPCEDNKGLMVQGANGVPYAPSNWAFQQVATLAGAPSGYLRTLPAPMAADCVNYGLQVARDVDECGILLTRDQGAGIAELRAVTGPNYGRVWNAEISGALVDRFGDGVSGQWRVPGIFGKRVAVTKDNTTLFAGDRDMFVFLADEDRRIEIPNRRDGKAGSMARGFFVWNSETGAGTLGAAFFLFDYVCANRIVWGARDFKEFKIRHTSGAPDRWMQEITPVLREYATASAKPVLQAIEDARSKKIAGDIDDFLAKRFTKQVAAGAIRAHLAEEHRPIQTVWDAVTGVTAYARNLENQDVRVKLEREAGALMA